MNRTIIGFLGKLIILVGLSMVVPLLMSVYDNEHIMDVYLTSIAVTLACGGLCLGIGHGAKSLLRIRDGFLLVTLAWLSASFFGTMPMFMSGYFPNYLDAFFETLSGFTATGITVLAEVESLPRSILLWRSMTQWLGGMGIVVLFVAMLSGVSGSTQLLNAEVTGPVKGKLSPRSSDSAKILWIIYLILTLLNFLALVVCGMGLFDAANHAMSTVSTGGYSTRNDGILAFPQQSVQWVTMVFMFLSACSFAMYYRVFRRRSLRVLWHNGEWRFFVLLVLLFSALIVIVLYPSGEYGLMETIRIALFNVVALFSSTCFVTVDYDVWPPFLQLLVLLIIFMGGCAGSTAGGVKLERVMILLRQSRNELRNMLHPRMITSLKINGSVIPNRVVINVAIYVFLFAAIIIFSTFFAAAVGLPMLEAFTTSLTCICNSGPSFGAYGPTEPFSTLPSVLKAYYCALMLFGRLELYTILVLFLPRNIKH